MAWAQEKRNTDSRKIDGARSIIQAPRVHDRKSRRQGLGRQVVVGDDGWNAGGLQPSDAGVAGDAVVDGHDPSRLRDQGRHTARQGLGEPITLETPVRHQEVYTGAKLAQGAHQDCAR